MSSKPKLKRRAFFVDDSEIKRARKILRVRTDSEAVRLSVRYIAEMERFWRFMDRTGGTLPPGSFGEI